MNNSTDIVNNVSLSYYLPDVSNVNSKGRTTIVVTIDEIKYIFLKLISLTIYVLSRNMQSSLPLHRPLLNDSILLLH